jgi:hypothetical protein
MELKLGNKIMRMVFIIIITILFMSCSNNKNNNSKDRNDEDKIVDVAANHKDEILPEISNLNKPNNINWGKKMVNSPEGLNMRKDPEPNSEKITLIPNSSIVNILKKDVNNVTIDDINDRWYFVQYNEYYGWVFGGYLIDTEKDDVRERLQYRMIFIEREGGKFNFDSIMIEENTNMNRIENYMIDDNTYFKLTQSENEEYVFEYNFLPMLGTNRSYNEINVIVNKNSTKPFYVYLGEKGGGYTRIEFTLFDEKMLVKLDHEQVEIYND